MYRKSCCTNPGVSIGGGGGSVDKMLKFYVKGFMWLARGCQASYPVHGKVLLENTP